MKSPLNNEIYPDESGFFNDVGAHTARTIMFQELAMLFNATTKNSHIEEIRNKVYNENILHKKSISGRKKSFGYLKKTYRLDPNIPLYNTLRWSWSISEEQERPLLALLCALSRDTSLRITAPYILSLLPGKIGCETPLKVPFDLEYWTKTAKELYADGIPEPHSDDPTQWLFKRNIVGSEQPLHVAIARMLGYPWPEQPAGEDPLDALIDKDGIVCIPPVRGERPAGDWLRSILATAYGVEWSPRKEEELLKQVGYTKSGGLEGFLRDEFFASHCKLFHQRPFIWQVWDGTKDGFSALINYHKLDHNTLQKLIYTYLGNWITQQKDEVKQEKPGAERRLAAAEALKENLAKILEGEKPFDIYVRWKPLNEQAIGWEPDLNDGVRMNIRPFIEAGVLRWTPNIKWGKDRGTDPVPNCSGTTERLNDLHFSLEEKRKARENAGKV